MNEQYSNYILMIVGILLIILGLYGPKDNLYDKLKSYRLKSYYEKQNKGVLVFCKKCNGTGQIEQDVNLLIAEASFAVWGNIHISSNKCEVCSKEKLCEVAQKKYDNIMTEYKKLGPKIEKANCPKCMGCGSYMQYKGYRVGREKL